MATCASLVYYVSGHGFGHARRAAEVISALLRRRNDLRIAVRTAAPAWLFAGLGPRVSHEQTDLDPGCVERDLLTIDPKETADRAAAFLWCSGQIVQREAEFIRRSGADLIVADIPFLAGEIAGEADIPCIGISNFTWDWIYEDLLKEDPDRDPLVKRIRQSYSHMSALLRIPWGGVAATIPRIIDCPLIARVSRRDEPDILPEAGIDRNDPRPRILIAMRGGIDPEVLQRVAAESTDCLFLQLAPAAADTPENLRLISPASPLDFSDLLSVSHAVISKIGYGIIADCIAARKRLLWPRRSGFCEDALSERQAQRFIPLRELPLDDFRAGAWSSHLQALLNQPMPADTAPTNGADICAEHLLANDLASFGLRH